MESDWLKLQAKEGKIEGPWEGSLWNRGRGGVCVGRSRFPLRGSGTSAEWGGVTFDDFCFAPEAEEGSC